MFDAESLELLSKDLSQMVTRLIIRDIICLFSFLVVAFRNWHMYMKCESPKAKDDWLICYKLVDPVD